MLSGLAPSPRTRTRAGNDAACVGERVRSRPWSRVRRDACRGSQVGPSGVSLGTDHLEADGVYQRTFCVVGYPREVARGWLAPLLRAAGDLDLTLHIEPVAPALAADRLRRQRARLESSRRLDADKGRLVDPTIEAAAQDADELAGRLARGESRLLRGGIYLSVKAGSREELEERCERTRALCASLLLHVVPATFRALDGWISTLPVGLDRLRLRRSFDTGALAAAFPFASADPPLEENGVFYGLTPGGAPVIADRFARENYNEVLLALSGAGKSYMAKLEALRLLYRGVQVFVIDPEDEYRRMCEAAGGVYLPLTGAGSVAINPLDLPADGSARALDDRILFLAELVELLAGGLVGGELAVLDRAARACYAAAGITADPASHSRPAPLLRDLVDALAQEGSTGASLAERLSPYATGSHSSLFDSATSARPDGHLVCWSLRGLPERMRAPALLLVLDAIWRSIDGPLRRRAVYVDEAHILRDEPAGARFLFRLSKTARKRWCALSTIAQDADDLLSTDLGRAVVNNAATQILMRQSAQAIDQVGEAFKLSAGERRYLVTCPVGSGLLLSGEDRVPFHGVASAEEDALVTTDPAELAERQQQAA
jgi:type IV secretory pathway VirB4 component